MKPLQLQLPMMPAGGDEEHRALMPPTVPLAKRDTIPSQPKSIPGKKNLFSKKFLWVSKKNTIRDKDWELALPLEYTGYSLFPRRSMAGKWVGIQCCQA